jgi:hypothetical protein
VPKGKDKVCVIHDLSRPHGGVNVFGVDSSVKYATIDEALLFMSPNCFLGKIDLSEAYRSVPINPACFDLTGIHWLFDGDSEYTYLYDARLPFGSSLSCKSVLQSFEC